MSTTTLWKRVAFFASTAVIFGLTGCSDRTNDAVQSETAAPPPAVAAMCPDSVTPPAPTAGRVMDVLRLLADKDVPLSERVTYLQGAADDPNIMNRFADELQRIKYSATVRGVVDYCNGTAAADGTATFDGQTHESQVPLIFDAGNWKVNKIWTCELIANAQLSSPMCPKGTS